MSAVLNDTRQHPSSEFIAGVRERYPVEPEIDRVLTRKMQGRSGAVFENIPLRQMEEATKALIGKYYQGDFSVMNVRWLSGGASKIQMAFDFVSAEKNDQFEAGVVTPMVVRMEPAESVVETSRKREFELLSLLKNKLPIPDCFWLDAEAEFYPYPAMVYAFANGVVKPSTVASKQVTGIGINFGPERREKLADQFVRHLATLHTLPVFEEGVLPSFEKPVVGTNSSVIKQINWWRRVWEEDRGADIPLLEVAYQWLVANAPSIETPSLVHGDYRSGNFLFDETSLDITAFLDWELALVGDRHQDLAWSTYKLFGHVAEDDKTHLVCGLLSEQEFFRRYEDYSGLSVDKERLLYYRVLCNFMSVVHSLGTAYRAAKGGKTHQDIVITTFSKIGYMLLEQLREYMEELTDAA
ncbi:MAG: phosphotransferase family protein [Porticoccaceae bacterium]